MQRYEDNFKHKQNKLNWSKIKLIKIMARPTQRLKMHRLKRNLATLFIESCLARAQNYRSNPMHCSEAENGLGPMPCIIGWMKFWFFMHVSSLVNYIFRMYCVFLLLSIFWTVHCSMWSFQTHHLVSDPIKQRNLSLFCCIYFCS